MTSDEVLEALRSYTGRDHEAARQQLEAEARRIAAKGNMTDSDASHVLSLLKRTTLTRETFAEMVEGYAERMAAMNELTKGV